MFLSPLGKYLGMGWLGPGFHVFLTSPELTKGSMLPSSWESVRIPSAPHTRTHCSQILGNVFTSSKGAMEVSLALCL